jgi:hypothetical protein
MSPSLDHLAVKRATDLRLTLVSSALSRVFRKSWPYTVQSRPPGSATALRPEAALETDVAIDTVAQQSTMPATTR